MQRIDERRIRRREVRAPLVILAFESAQCGINAETAEHNDDGENFDPPGIAAQSAAEARFGHKSRGASHSVTSGVRVGYAKTRLFQTKFWKMRNERRLKDRFDFGIDGDVGGWDAIVG